MSNTQHSQLSWPSRMMALIIMCLVVACTTSAPPPTRPAVEEQPIAGGPVILRAEITLRKVVEVGPGNIRLAINPVNGAVYMLNPIDGLYLVDLKAGTTTLISPLADILPQSTLTGLAVGPDGTIYIVSNLKFGDNLTVASIRRAVADSTGKFKWETLTSTEPYPTSNTPFDHTFNGLAVSPDGQWLYVNSGSRTDHGEVEDNDGAFNDTREVGLTAKIFRLPIGADRLSLPTQESELAAQGLIFARGVRNAYDLAFGPNGDLFAIDNGPDADYPDELNWIREGRHYGFPWRFSNQDNPQQFSDYDSNKDQRLHSDFTAVKIGAYKNDPTFPKPPGDFTDPIINLGPDAAYYRGDDGGEYNAAAEGKPAYTFTPHRSPLGLVFATDPALPADLRSDDRSLSAFLVNWGSAGGTLTDRGLDLLHLRLTKKGDNYEATVTQIARDFKSPIDTILIENRLYVLEYGDKAAVWELIFK